MNLKKSQFGIMIQYRLFRFVLIFAQKILGLVINLNIYSGKRENPAPLWAGMRTTLREINNKFYQKIQVIIKFLYKDFNRAGTARINAFGHCSNSYVNEKGSHTPRGWGSSPRIQEKDRQNFGWKTQNSNTNSSLIFKQRKFVLSIFCCQLLCQ